MRRDQVIALADARAAIPAKGDQSASREQALDAIESWLKVKGQSTGEEQRAARGLLRSRTR